MEKPVDANENCPGGPGAQDAGKAAACAGCPNQSVCASAPKGPAPPDPDLIAIAEKMSHIKHKILVLSGKGGVGKSTFAAQLAFHLAESGKEVGILDIDICGPSIPKMLGLEGEEIHQSGSGWSPVYLQPNLAVMSIGFLLTDPNDAVVWRGPRKSGLIKQFLKDVDWGSLDYLVVDAPPGTSDEHISIAQYLAGATVDGAVVVTTPQEVSLIDVRKELSFCAKVGFRVLGVVENMSGLQIPLSSATFSLSRTPPPPAAAPAAAGGAAVVQATTDVTAEVRAALAVLAAAGTISIGADVFCSGGRGGEKIAAEFGVPFLGRVPLDPQLTAAAESGLQAGGGTVGGAHVAAIVARLRGALEGQGEAMPAWPNTTIK